MKFCNKAKAENGVLQAQRWILAVLRHRRLEVNEAIQKCLVKLNEKFHTSEPMRGYGKSRRELYEL